MSSNDKIKEQEENKEYIENDNDKTPLSIKLYTKYLTFKNDTQNALDSAETASDKVKVLDDATESIAQDISDKIDNFFNNLFKK